METVQTVSFVMLMAGASWWDIHKRIFPDYYVFLLILVAASGLVLGFGKTCAAVILGICFLLLFHGAGTVVRAMQKKEPCQYYPMVPFLAAGNLILYIYGGSGR